MRDLLELLIRVRWWFYGDHLRYDKYYDIARIRKLGLDPRSNRRAHFKGELALAIGILVAFEIAMMTLEVQLHFDKLLGPLNLNLALAPVGFIRATFAYAFTGYADPHIDKAIHDAFRIAWTAFGYATAGAFLFSNSVYRSSRWDRTDLTTEHGTARWITPDELSDKRGSLLPDGYDVVFGFSREAKARMKASSQSIAIAIPSELVAKPQATPEAWSACAVAVLISFATYFGALPSLFSFGLETLAAAAFGFILRTHLGTKRVLIGAGVGAAAGVVIAGILLHLHDGVLATALLGIGVGAAAGVLSAFATNPETRTIEISTKTLPVPALGVAIVFAFGTSMHEPLAINIIAALAIGALMLLKIKNLQPIIVAAIAGAALPYITRNLPILPPTLNDPTRLAMVAVTIVAGYMVTRTLALPPEKTPA